jgi:hypothetical protein
MKIFLVGALVSAIAMACVPPPVSRATYGEIPRDFAAQCSTTCAYLGMRMSSVVLIANSGGCVCVPLDEPIGGPGASASATAAGGAVIVAAEQAEAARRARNNSTTTTRHVGVQHP